MNVRTGHSSALVAWEAWESTHKAREVRRRVKEARLTILGVWHDGQYYWSDQMYEMAIGSMVDVSYRPGDPGSVRVSCSFEVRPVGVEPEIKAGSN